MMLLKRLVNKWKSHPLFQLLCFHLYAKIVLQLKNSKQVRHLIISNIHALLTVWLLLRQQI